MTAHGTFETIDDRPALRFERRLRHAPERVWAAITDASDLAQWFPDSVRADWRPGGAVHFSSPHVGESSGEVLVCDPPRRLAYTWYTNELRFELEPDGDGTRLRLIALLDEREAAARDAAGWHVCLDRLEQALATGDAEAPGPDRTAEWSDLYEAYQRRGVPAGAWVPEG